MSHDHDLTLTLAALLDVEPTALAPDLPLSQIPLWDSVTALRILAYLERETGLLIDYEEFTGAETVGSLMRVVCETTTEAGAA